MIRIALAQVNPTVGDIDGNTAKIIEYIKKARDSGVDLVVFPELVITGYPPKDLLLKPSFIEANRRALAQILSETADIAVILGFVDHSNAPFVSNIYDISALPKKTLYNSAALLHDRKLIGIQHKMHLPNYDVSALPKKTLYNSAALLHDRKLIGIQHKIHLPNYDVFDEKRYFKPGTENRVFSLGKSRHNLKLGINIREDIWVDGHGPTEKQVELGAELIVNISASPFYAGKSRLRRELIAMRARANKVPIAYVNLVGGQDELVFDGRSGIFNDKGALIAEGEQFKECLITSTLDSAPITPPDEADRAEMTEIEEIFNALLLGIKDYVRKNGFRKVVIGLSGGIDSALTTVLATEALGAHNVVGVAMPSAITSSSSIEDAKRLAANLGIEFKVIPIVEAVNAYTRMLSEEFKDTTPDVTEENIQARIRGNVLMALSNKFGYLVLSTGNKSELAVGYCTLYGDMSGGLAAISDVPKTMVYELAEYYNTLKGAEVIPHSIIVKAPSAELRAGQKDTDSLPPYEVLDPILHAYIEENKSKEEIIEMGFDAEVVSEVIWKVDHNEYKRQQAPIGIKITPKAFGTGRRMPITNRYNE